MNIKIDFYLIVSIVILTFFRQVETFLIFYLFVALHELAHIFVAYILKIKVLEVSFLPFGVNAKFDFSKHKYKEILISSAGPIFSISMTFLLKDFFIQNIFIFLINMIPIYPLDGGRILKNIIILIFGAYNGTKIYNILLRIFIIILAIINITLVVILKNYRFLFVSLYIFQIASEEIKKDKIRENLTKLLNIEI